MRGAGRTRRGGGRGRGSRSRCVRPYCTMAGGLMIDFLGLVPRLPNGTVYNLDSGGSCIYGYIDSFSSASRGGSLSSFGRTIS